MFGKALQLPAVVQEIDTIRAEAVAEQTVLVAQRMGCSADVCREAGDIARDAYMTDVQSAHRAICDGVRYASKLTPARHRNEKHVRFGSEGQRVVYADAADASEHGLRMAEGRC